MRSLLVAAAAMMALCNARADEGGRVWVCPMHADVRAGRAGCCPRCGMELAESARDAFAAFPVEVLVEPRTVPVGEPLEITVAIHDPRTGEPAPLEPVHGELVHLFLVSGDLAVLQHLHPSSGATGFQVVTRLPRPGRWSVIADFLPRGAMAQLVARSILTANWQGPITRAALGPDTLVYRDTVDGQTLALATSAPLVAGVATSFTFAAPPGLERWIDAWAHALLVSDDLEEVVHAHADRAGDRLTLTLTAPRPGRYRLWIQLSRSGRIVTAPYVVTAAGRGAAFLR